MEYNPTVALPALTSAGEARLRDRFLELARAVPKRQLTPVERNEQDIIAAIFAAAVREPLATVGEAWDVVAFKLSHSQRERAEVQNGFAEAAAEVIKLMTA